MESVARAVVGDVVANLQAKLFSQDRREVDYLLMADDRATDVQFIDGAVDEGNRAQLGGPGVQAIDLGTGAPAVPRDLSSSRFG
jgi:hypothetical protein